MTTTASQRGSPEGVSQRGQRRRREQYRTEEWDRKRPQHSEREHPDRDRAGGDRLRCAEEADRPHSARRRTEADAFAAALDRDVVDAGDLAS